jgi:two-component system chemotaxis response regulator CheB
MENNENIKYEAVVIGVSAGGLQAMSRILEELPPDFPIPVIVTQHRSKEEKSLLEEVLQSKCSIRIKQADEKEQITNGTVYFAPADYHLLVEKNHSFSLDSDAPINYSRPSIDVLFTTASKTYENKLIGIILTGASNDGAAGIEAIRKHGGTTIAQNPLTAQFPFMPQAAIDTGSVQYIFELEELRDFLLSIGKN